MKCAELMKTDVVCANLDQSVREAAQLMEREEIGFLPVCNEDGRLVGVVTDRDIVLRVVAPGKDPERVKLHAAITADDLVTCSPDDELVTAEVKMIDGHKSRIAVVDEAFRCVGVISLSDIAQEARLAQAGAVLRKVSEREIRPTSH